MEGKTVTLDLYVRSLSPRGTGGRLDDVLEALSTLQSQGSVDSYQVTVWGDVVRVDGPAAETRPGAETLATVELFESWAETEGTDFPAEEGTRGTMADDPRCVLKLPPVALAERQDGDLTQVTPHVRDGAVTTVDDHVGSLLARSRGETIQDSDADRELLVNPG